VKEVEASARTLEEAIQKALEKLNANRDEVELTVLSEGSHGIFGVGGELARVKASLKELPPKGVPAQTSGDMETARQLLAELLDKMDVEAEIEYIHGSLITEDEDKENVVFDIQGEDLALLIGRHGQTLTNLQYLFRLMVQSRIGQFLPIVIDVNGYRARRIRSLEVLARRTAEQVRLRRVPQTLEPMPPFERRVIHLVLADDPEVTTESEGFGEERRVVIMLRDEEL